MMAGACGVSQESAILAVLFGLGAAASWGAGDFSGGVASRRSHVFGVVILSQLIGGAGLALLALAVAEPWPAPADLWWGAAAGLSGAVGLSALYRGLATGRMGVVAPVTAVVAAGAPVLAAAWLEGWPAPAQLLAFALALAAVWLLTRTGADAPVRGADLRLPLLAGAGFGLFFILIDRITPGVVLWPLVAARVASLSALTGVVAAGRRRRAGALLGRNVAWTAVILAGLFDSGGNAFFALATQAGRLDIAAVLSSLYPAATVLLARLVLQERLAPWQWAGVAVALAAVLLLTVSPA